MGSTIGLSAKGTPASDQNTLMSASDWTRKVYQKEHPAMEVEEALHRDSPSEMDTMSADSETEEPPAPKVPPKALPRRLHAGISRQPNGACGEVSSSDEDIPSVKAHSPRAQAPKPCKGEKAASPVPASEMGQSAEASPEAHAPKPEQPPPHTSAREDPIQPGRTLTQPTIGGLAGAPATFPGLFSSHLYNPVFVPVPITVSIPVLVTVPVALSPFMSGPVPLSVSVPVSVVVLAPVFPSAVLLTLARIGLLSLSASPFSVGFRAVAR
ncbi:hypothetical protein P4O66_001808 [Electrophorus voltai]|uniref:Uncharacterized protein n=1 Tax=Electrophorus voltai TaxID=2609070 RepID=A0AAD9DR39_9TELE|nr:hypothetical protein P4O66_001808 [Electrophorus voltai]